MREAGGEGRGGRGGEKGEGGGGRLCMNVIRLGNIEKIVIKTFYPARILEY